MKKESAIPLKPICILLLGIILHFSPNAQCISTLLKSVTYDTLIAGSGNDSYTFSLSKFNPALGTLVSTKITSSVSVNYGFVLKNVEGVSRNFSISVGRVDYFQSAALADIYNNLVQVNIGTFPLSPGNTVSQPTSPIISRYLNTDSVTSNLANFMGSGTVSFDYEPTTYTTLLGSANYYYSANANDTVHFSITYLYCNATTLPVKISDFQAVKEDQHSIGLSWTADNEWTANNYEIQKSSDATHFASVALVPTATSPDGHSSYTHHYAVSPSDWGKIYFRVKENEKNGGITYSETRMVDLGNLEPTGLTLYPNPANNFVNLVFGLNTAHNWRLDIFAANGKLIQTDFCINAASARIVFKEKPASGVYFIRATDQQTQASQIRDFVIN